jgi:hypothetical protein
MARHRNSCHLDLLIAAWEGFKHENFKTFQYISTCRPAFIQGHTVAIHGF